MSDGGTRGRAKLGELIDAALADGEPAAHAGFVADLAAVTRTPDAIEPTAERLLAEGDRGRRVFLEWLARLRVRLPDPLVEAVPPLLSDPAIPDDLRARVAARALRSARNTKDFLTRLAPALTDRLSPLAVLRRLRAVQNQLPRSRALDRLIARRERRLRLACPRCGIRLRRAELSKHMAESHGLILDEGRARYPGHITRGLLRQYANGRDTTILDQAAQLTDDAALRTWAAQTGLTADDRAALAGDAVANGHGLCPSCLGELPPSVAPLPPPLTLAAGRLAGEGYAVEVRGPDGFRTCEITTPTGQLRSGLDGPRAVGPRAAGILAAAGALLVAVAVRMPIPLAVLVAALAYAAGRFLRAPLPPPADRAVDRAWTGLVPRVVSDAVAAEFVIRLCRASVGCGSPGARAGSLTRLAHENADPRLRAAATFLRIHDAGRLGVDRVAGTADLIAAAFTDGPPLAIAEHVAELFLTNDAVPTPGERARLRVLVLQAAFAAGFTPRGLADLWAACPRLRELIATVPLSRIGLQYVSWRLRESRPWEADVPAGTVFDLARVAPTLGGRLLAAHPDLLLYHRPPPPVDEALGWVLLCASGVVIGQETITDPDSDVSVEGGRLIGSAHLVVGPRRFALPRRPPPEFVTHLRRLLRLRAEVFLPRLDAALAVGSAPGALDQLARRCRCGADVLVSVGQIGRLVRERPE